MNKFNIYPDSIPYWLTSGYPEQEDILQELGSWTDRTFASLPWEPDGNPFLHGWRTAVPRQLWT